jgi:hypothetical protein
MEDEADRAVTQRNQAFEHLKLMKQKVAVEREYNMAYEKDLNKALNKYKPSHE